MVDDAILSIEETRGPPTFKNRNKKDTNTNLGKKPKERELTKTHQSWVQSGNEGSTLNDLMKTESGAYD
jgi:hypothetical protein